MILVQQNLTPILNYFSVKCITIFSCQNVTKANQFSQYVQQRSQLGMIDGQYSVLPVHHVWYLLMSLVNMHIFLRRLLVTTPVPKCDWEVILNRCLFNVYYTVQYKFVTVTIYSNMYVNHAICKVCITRILLWCVHKCKKLISFNSSI